MHVDYKLIGQRIKEQRKKCGYTQEFLAERLNVSVGYVSQVERGITKISLDLLAAVSTALQCDLSLLVTGAAVSNDDYRASEISKLYGCLDARDKYIAAEMLRLLGQKKP